MLIVLALLLSGARLFLPLLEHYQDELQQRISETVGQPVSVKEFGIGWHGLGPRLYLNSVALHDHSGERTLLSFRRAYIDVSVPDSIYRGQLAVSSLTLDGVELRLLHSLDGKYSLEGMQASTGTPQQGGAAAFNWLLSQDRLALENSRIQWRDEAKPDQALMLDHISVYLSNDGGEHHLNGRLQLPKSIGGNLNVIADARGLVEEDVEPELEFYLSGDGLKLSQWLSKTPFKGVTMGVDHVDVELWGQWQNGGITGVQGQVVAEELELAAVDASADKAPAAKRFQALSGQFDWRRGVTGWQLELDNLAPVVDSVVWPVTRVHVEHYRYEEHNDLIIATDYGRIEDILDVLALSTLTKTPLKDFINQAKPRGHLQEAYLEIALGKRDERPFFARMQVDNASLDAYDGKPGIEGADLYVNLDHRGGKADIHTRHARLDIRPLFREAWQVDALNGHLAWQFGDEGLSLDMREIGLSNPDIELLAGGSVFIPAAEGTPVIDLLADIKRGSVASARSYLPTKIMHKNLVDWLDRGLVAGDLANGGLVLQGPLKKFPFRQGEGRFEVRANVSDAIVDYVDGWPRGEEVEASLAFVGSGMDILIVDGQILSSDIQQLALEIPNFFAKPATLSLFGNLKGDSGDLIDYINQTPIKALLGDVTDQATAAGDSELQLAMEIPFGPDQSIRTRGIVALDNADVDLVALGVDIKSLNGALEFGDKGLAAEGVLATVMGQTSVINIETVSEKTGQMDLQFKAEGRTNIKELAKRVELPVYDFLQGDSEWRAELIIPAGSEARKVEPTLRVESNLRGMEVRYPPPLAKTRDAGRFFELSGSFGKKAMSWYFDYDNETLSGVFRVPSGKAALSGELRLAGVAKLPDAAGLRIAGDMKHFDFEQWLPVLEAEEAGADAKQEDVVRWVDLNIASVEIFGQTLHDVDLDGERGNKSWKAKVSSQELIGEILLPDDWNRVLIMDLERLYLSAAEEEEAASDAEEPFNPSELPPVVINSQDTRYGKLELGKMELVTVKKVSGLAVETLSVDSRVLGGSAKGVWMRPASGIHTSSIQADLNVKDLGVLLGQLGYAKTIKFGRGKGQLALNWQGPLNDPDAASMAGDISFNFKDGRLLEVEPGAGRLFGLLSITALPRRLLLDFSDLFGKGFAFDKLKGRFDIKDGNALTDNFVLDGPAARVEMDGRVGLVTEDYDQIARVVPHVTSGLPTLAGAGILTGGAGIAPAAIVLLLEKLLKPGVDKITEVHYSITGSWDDPVIEPVGGKAEPSGK